jgi:hypothetical protein
MKRTITSLAMAMTAVAAFGSLAPPAQASAPVRGACPGGNSGFVLWDVSAEPYGADNFVDERGNNDGLACARPIYVVTDENGEPFQIYNFLDNQFVAHG